MLRSGEMGSLSAGPGSPTDTADKNGEAGRAGPGSLGTLVAGP